MSGLISLPLWGRAGWGFWAGSAVSNTFRVRRMTPLAAELACLQDRGVDLDRQRTAEELHEHLHPGRRIQLTLEDGVDHPERSALDDDMLTLRESGSGLF